MALRSKFHGKEPSQHSIFIPRFELDELEQQLADEGVGVDSTSLRDEWLTQIEDIVSDATLSRPEDDWVVNGGRTGYHTENLGHLLTEMQFLHRSNPGCEWRA